MKDREEDGYNRDDQRQNGIAQPAVILARLFYPRRKLVQLMLLAAVPRLELFNQGGLGRRRYQRLRDPGRSRSACIVLQNRQGDVIAATLLGSLRQNGRKLFGQ